MNLTATTPGSSPFRISLRSIAGDNLELDSTNHRQIHALPNDGVVTGGSVSGGTATFTRSVGGDVDVTGFFTEHDVPPFALFEEGIELTGDLQGINFRGFEVVVLDTPQNIANIRFGSILQDEGSELSEDGAHIVNYTGAGITASFGSTNVLTIDVPGTADGVLDLLNLSRSGARQLNLTLGRSQGLAAITDAVQLPIATWAVDNDTLATGTAPPARLGTGTPSSSVFLRGDGAWAAAGGGGTVDGVVSTAHLSTTGARQLDLTLERTNGLSNIQTGINLPIALWAVSDSALATGTAPPDRLGTGTRSGSNFLRADGVWADPPAAGASAFTELTDTPSTITADDCVAGNAAGTALEFVTCGSGGGGTTVVANPGGSPADALTTITIGSTDYSIEGSGGGGTPLAVTTGGHRQRQFHGRGCSTSSSPTPTRRSTLGSRSRRTRRRFYANWGAASNDATAGLDLPWFAITIEEWDRLDGVNAGDTPTQGNTRFTRTWRNTDITTLGGTAARQIWIAKGNNGNMSSSSRTTCSMTPTPSACASRFMKFCRWSRTSRVAACPPPLRH